MTNGDFLHFGGTIVQVTDITWKGSDACVALLIVGTDRTITREWTVAAFLRHSIELKRAAPLEVLAASAESQD